MLGVARAVMLGAAGRGGPAAGATWAELFTALGSPPGVAYTFGNPATLRASRTTGAFGVSSSDPIGYALDVSRGATDSAGPGIHANATSDASRPVYGSFDDGGAATAAQFNGSTHCLQTVSALDLTSTDEVHVFAAVRSLASVLDVVAEFSADWTAGAGRWVLTRQSGFTFGARGTAQALAATLAYAAPDSSLLYGRAKIAAPIASVSRNSVQTTATVSQGTGNFSAQLVNIGARDATAPALAYAGRIANLAIIGGPMTAEQIAVAESLCGAGLTFSP